VGEKRGEADLPCFLVDSRGLDRRNLMLAEALANDIEPASEGCITERPTFLARKGRSNRRDQQFFRVAELTLRLGQSGGDRTDGVTGAVHRRPPCP
jgi:hypothetical protein